MNRGYYHVPYSRPTEWGGGERREWGGAQRAYPPPPPYRASLGRHAMPPDRLASSLVSRHATA